MFAYPFSILLRFEINGKLLLLDRYVSALQRVFREQLTMNWFGEYYNRTWIVSRERHKKKKEKQWSISITISYCKTTSTCVCLWFGLKWVSLLEYCKLFAVLKRKELSKVQNKQSDHYICVGDLSPKFLY